jgi:hypothetical protein
MLTSGTTQYHTDMKAQTDGQHWMAELRSQPE